MHFTPLTPWEMNVVALSLFIEISFIVAYHVIFAQLIIMLSSKCSAHS